MKIPKQSKIELCVSDDAYRKAIQNILLTNAGTEAKPEWCLVATDGRRLVRVPVTAEEGDTQGLVTPDAVRLARRQCKRRDDEAQINVNGTLELKDGTSLPRPVEEGENGVGQYPNWKQCFPGKDQKVQRTIGLNARLLHELAQAMGTDSVHIDLLDDGESATKWSPFVVRPAGEGAVHGSIGLLMPLVVS